MDERPKPPGLNVLDERSVQTFGAIEGLPPTVRVSLDGPVLYREWVVGPAGRYGWIAGVALGIALVVAAAALIASGGALRIAGGICAGLAGSSLLLTSVAFRGLSLVIDREGVEWAFGPFRRRFAHGEVQMFRAREFAFKKVGGWGIGRAHDGVDVYQVWGANGTALDLVVKRADVTHHFLISTVAPEQACAAIVRANAPAVPRPA